MTCPDCGHSCKLISQKPGAAYYRCAVCGMVIRSGKDGTETVSGLLLEVRG